VVVVKSFIKIIQKEIEPAGWLARLDWLLNFGLGPSKDQRPKAWIEMVSDINAVQLGILPQRHIDYGITSLNQ